MKKQELFKKIKESALAEMPEVFDRINIDQIVIDEIPTKKTKFNLRKAFSYTFASFILLLSGFSIYTFGVLPNITNTTPLESDTELIAFQTITGSTLIESLEPAELSTSFSSSDIIDLSYSTTEITSPAIEDEIDSINKYMKLAETFIDNQNSYIYESVDSDNPDYQYAFEYRSKDLLGNLITYQGYYNTRESLGRTLYNGIIIQDDVEYRFSNSIRVHNDNSFNVYKIELDEDNFVEVTNYSNKNIQKFEYKVYANGMLENTSELELTEKNNQLQAKLLLNKSTDNELSLEITNNSESNIDQYRINYRFVNSNKVGQISISLEEDQTIGQYRYKYVTENATIVKDRSIKSNGPATDEDFQPGNSRQPFDNDDDLNNPTTTEDNSTNETTTEDDFPGNQTPGNKPTSYNNAEEDSYYSLILMNDYFITTI